MLRWMPSNWDQWDGVRSEPGGDSVSPRPTNGRHVQDVWLAGGKRLWAKWRAEFSTSTLDFELLNCPGEKRRAKHGAFLSGFRKPGSSLCFCEVMESKGLFVLAEAEHFLEIQACFPPVLSCFPLCQGAGRIPSPPQLLILSLIHLKRHQPPAWEPTAPRGLSKGKIVTRIGRTSGVTVMLPCSQEGFWGRGP